MPLAWISLTLSHHFSLLFITSGRSSGLHPVSSHSCWMYVRAGHPAFAQPYVGVHRSTSLMSSSLLDSICLLLEFLYCCSISVKVKEYSGVGWDRCHGNNLLTYVVKAYICGGNGIGHQISNPGSLFALHFVLLPLGIHLFSFQLWVNRADWVIKLWYSNQSRRKTELKPAILHLKKLTLCHILPVVVVG